MALISCPECSRKISNKAEACLYCGFPVAKTVKIQKMSEPIAETNYTNTECSTNKSHKIITDKPLRILFVAMTIYIANFTMHKLLYSVGAVLAGITAIVAYYLGNSIGKYAAAMINNTDSSKSVKTMKAYAYGLAYFFFVVALSALVDNL